MRGYGIPETAPHPCIWAGIVNQQPSCIRGLYSHLGDQSPWWLETSQNHDVVVTRMATADVISHFSSCSISWFLCHQAQWRSLAHKFEDNLWHILPSSHIYFNPYVVVYSALGVRDLGFQKPLKFSLFWCFFWQKWAELSLVFVLVNFDLVSFSGLILWPGYDCTKALFTKYIQFCYFRGYNPFPWPAVDSMRTTNIFCWFSSQTSAERSAIAW